jgi:hypothetical protein
MASLPSALTFTSGRTGARPRSASVTSPANPGAWPMPPPSTTRAGSTTVTTLQIALATSRASAATIAPARSSPRAAASKTRRAETGPRMPARRAARTIPAAAAADSSGPRRRTSPSAAPASGPSPLSGIKAISPATPCAPRCSRPSSTRPIPMPVPTCTQTKSAVSRPCPWLRSASAAASTSFSTTRPGPKAARSPSIALGRSQPASPPVSAMALRLES